MPTVPQWLIYAIIIWSLLWKGLALWFCARQEQKLWYIAILVLNTIGILEIIYLFRFSKKRMTLQDLKNWQQLYTQRPIRTIK